MSISMHIRLGHKSDPFMNSSFVYHYHGVTLSGEERGEAWSQLKSPGRHTLFPTWYIPGSQAEHTASRTYIYLQEFLSLLHRFQIRQPLDSWRTFLLHSSGILKDTQKTHFNDFECVLLVYTCKKKSNLLHPLLESLYPNHYAIFYHIHILDLRFNPIHS